MILESFEYVFLYLEWNQARGTTDLAGRDVIQIGALGTEEDLDRKKIFSKMICPEDPSLLRADTCQKMHLTRENVLSGNSQEVIYHKFRLTFPVCQYLVMWSQEDYRLFRSGMRKSQIAMPRHKVVILQDIIETIIAGIETAVDFEAALEMAGVEFRKEYRYAAKWDVQYLHQLFVKLYRSYAERTAGEVCGFNQRTGKLHNSGCRYLKNSQTTDKNQIFHGASVCRHCEKKDSWKRINWEKEWRAVKHKRKQQIREELKKLPLTNKNIGRICKYHHVEYQILSDMVSIKTPYSNWRIRIKGDEVVKLMHENLRIKRSDYRKAKKYAEGFHEQKLPSKNFYEVIWYIKCHDKGLVGASRRKNTVEELLDKIGKE